MPETKEFDFAAWARLAREDAAAFERARRQAVERVIAGGEDPDKLARLQWRLDAERQRAKTPLKACLRFSGLMWETFDSLRHTLSRVAYGESPPPARRARRPAAAVLPLRRKMG